MTDLVQHLRESATDLCSPGGCCYGESMVKAADEIERLRAALRECAESMDHAHASAVALCALEQEEPQDFIEAKKERDDGWPEDRS